MLRILSATLLITFYGSVVWLLICSVPVTAFAPVPADNTTLIATSRSVSRRTRYLSEEEACRLDAGACYWNRSLRACHTIYTYNVQILRTHTHGPDRGYFNGCRHLARRLACSRIPFESVREAHFIGCLWRSRHCKIEIVAVPPQKCNQPGRNVVISNKACLRRVDQHNISSFFRGDLVCCLNKFTVEPS